MDTNLIIIAVVATIIAGFIGWLSYLQRKAVAIENSKVEGSKVMQLQAYERLTLLIDRISLSNVIGRVSNPAFNKRDMQMAIVHSINEEFTYNISQQIYVSTEAWNAIKNLKEQNLLVANQIAGILPVDATGLDFSKSVLEFLMNNPKGTLHEVVSEFISFEAKKLL